MEASELTKERGGGEGREGDRIAVDRAVSGLGIATMTTERKGTDRQERLGRISAFSFYGEFFPADISREPSPTVAIIFFKPRWILFVCLLSLSLSSVGRDPRDRRSIRGQLERARFEKAGRQAPKGGRQRGSRSRRTMRLDRIENLCL